MPDIHYCPAFWRLYDDLCKQADAGEIDDYGMAYRLKDHRLACKECHKLTEMITKRDEKDEK